MALRFSLGKTSAISASFQFQQGIHAVGYSSSENRRNGIPDLLCDFDLRPEELELIGKRLKTARLAVSYGTVVNRMEVAPLFGLKEFRSHGKCRLSPPEAAEEISSP
jgi:hypothetical protein